MKMVLVVYNEAIDDEVMEVLTTCGISSFTKFRQVLGRGILSEPHLDSNIWPGANNVCMVIIEDIQVDSLLDGIKSLRKTLSKEGIKAFVLPVEEAT